MSTSEDDVLLDDITIERHPNQYAPILDDTTLKPILTLYIQQGYKNKEILQLLRNLRLDDSPDGVFMSYYYLFIYIF